MKLFLYYRRCCIFSINLITIKRSLTEHNSKVNYNSEPIEYLLAIDRAGSVSLIWRQLMKKINCRSTNLLLQYCSAIFKIISSFLCILQILRYFPIWPKLGDHWPHCCPGTIWSRQLDQKSILLINWLNNNVQVQKYPQFQFYYISN